MKKHLLFFALVAAAFAAVVGCKDPMDEFSSQKPVVVAGGDFEIKMNLAPTTRTVPGEESFVDDFTYMSVNFAVGDAINLFHTEYNEQSAYSSYVDDGQFVVTEINDGVATLKGYIGADLNPDMKYDWFGIYPYSEETVSPERASINFPTKVKMNPEDPASTLAGTCCPLAGFAKGVSASAVPNILMRQLASVVAVQVNNITDDDITVNTIEIETSRELISGNYSLDCHLYQQYQDDKITFDSALYDLSDQPLRYDIKTTAGSSKKVTLDAGGYVVEAGDQCIFYIPVAPVTFLNLGSAMSIRVNDLYKPSTMKSIKQYYVSFDSGYYYLNVRHKFESGKINVFNFNYSFSDIENYPSIFKKYSEAKTNPSWFKNGHDINACLACNNTFKASAEEDAFSIFSYIWLMSNGFAGPSTGGKVGTVGMWENEGYEFVIPVKELTPGKSIVVEAAPTASATGMMNHESGDASKPQVWSCGGPAYYKCEYSTDCGKTWKEPVLESECKYTGDACDANICLNKLNSEGLNYFKAVCAVPGGMNNGTFLFRYRCVNASFSINDVREGKTVGCRFTGDNVYDYNNETSTYTGTTNFAYLYPDDPDKAEIFAVVSVTD